MAVTKYEPVNLAGFIADAVPTTVDYRGDSEDVFILTEIIVSNAASGPQQVTITWRNDVGTDIALFHEVTLPAHGTANLNCYIPLKVNTLLKAHASVIDAMHVTINGLKVVEV